jgi:hypothetical protein
MHTTFMTGSDNAGKERFECIECEYVAIMDWNSAREKKESPLTILITGDRSVQHSGSLGNDPTVGNLRAAIA